MLNQTTNSDGSKLHHIIVLLYELEFQMVASDAEEETMIPGDRIVSEYIPDTLEAILDVHDREGVDCDTEFDQNQTAVKVATTI